MIASPTSVESVIITCDFTFIRESCLVTEITNAETAEVTAILGNLTEGLTFDDITFFEGNSRGFLAFPRRLETFFSHLSAIRMENNEIPELGVDEFVHWPDLSMIALANNRIEKLDPRLFRNNPKLTFVSIDGNSLTTLDGDLFTQNPLIMNIRFSGNRIQNLGSGLFRNNPLASEVWFQSNLIETLDGDLFQHSPALIDVRFTNNSIQSVGADLFSHLSTLQLVDFRFNPCIDVIAFTPEEVSNLRAKLLTQCPQEDSCLARCTINEEVDDLLDLVAIQGQQIDQLSSVIDELRARVEILEG